MILKYWHYWLKTTPWSFKWFILLILLRPVIDIFYYLKDISPFLSPLYIVAGLTPVLVVLSVIFGKLPNIPTRISYLDILMSLWALIILLNGMLLLYTEDMLSALDMILRLTIPFFIYLYSRFFVRSLRTLLFVLVTMVLASIVPALMLLYENIIGPLGFGITRGDMIRYHGLYADVFQYGLHSIIAFIIFGYMYIGPIGGRIEQYITYKKLLIITFIVLLALISIVHTASWAIFIVVAGLFIYNVGRINILKLFSVLFLILIIGGFIFKDNISSTVVPLVQRELSVLKGERNIELLGHGRMGRIINYQAIWSEQQIETKVFGMAFSNEPDKINWMGGTIHNEYIRSLYTSGYIGMIMYLLILLISFMKSYKFPSAEKYLFQSMIIMVALYSVSSLPMLYTSIIYIFMPVIAYLSHSSSVKKNKIKPNIHAL